MGDKTPLTSTIPYQITINLLRAVIDGFAVLPYDLVESYQQHNPAMGSNVLLISILQRIHYEPVAVFKEYPIQVFQRTLLCFEKQ